MSCWIKSGFKRHINVVHEVDVMVKVWIFLPSRIKYTMADIMCDFFRWGQGEAPFSLVDAFKSVYIMCIYKNVYILACIFQECVYFRIY